MTKRKTDFALGVETILNNKATNFLRDPSVLTEIHSQSKMSLASMIKQVGRGSRQHQKRKEPTDEEKSKLRVDMMESKSVKETPK